MNDHLTSRLHDAPLQAATSRHEAMMAEARRIIDAGNDRGVVLRLTGGLAVRHYAIDLEFAERDYSDIDLIGLERQTTEIYQVFLDLGYQENIHVAIATGNSQRQYLRPQHALESRAHMSKRAHATPVMSAVPPSDHDVITLCKDVYVDFHPHPGVLDLERVAETCAGDWGLYIDVMSNIDKVLERLEDYDLSPMETNRIARTLELAQDMMTEHSKSLRWRVRAMRLVSIG